MKETVAFLFTSFLDVCHHCFTCQHTHVRNTVEQAVSWVKEATQSVEDEEGGGGGGDSGEGGG